MDTTTAQLYDILVEKGFDKTRVREALSEVVSRDEMSSYVDQGFDRVRAELKVELKGAENRLIMWMVGLQIAMAGLLVAARLVG